MRILIICSKAFYSKIPPVQKALESRNIDVVLPNCYDAPETEQIMWDKGPEEHRDFKAGMYKKSCDVISGVDAVLVLNYDKEKTAASFRIISEARRFWRCTTRSVCKRRSICLTVSPRVSCMTRSTAFPL